MLGHLLGAGLQHVLQVGDPPLQLVLLSQESNPGHEAHMKSLGGDILLPVLMLLLQLLLQHLQLLAERRLHVLHLIDLTS